MFDRGRVLVVDDVKVNAQVLADLLSGWGFEATQAYSAAEALDAIRLRPPHLVLMDVVMPVMNGYDLCARIKSSAATAHVPVVLITALKEVEQRKRGLEAGADDFITRPPDDLELHARVRSLVRLCLVQEELRFRERSLNAIVRRGAPTGDRRSRTLVAAGESDEARRLVSLMHPLRCEIMTVSEAGQAFRDAVLGVDLVVIDETMRGGLMELVRTMRREPHTAHIPLIVVSEQHDKQKKIEYLEQGADDYVALPEQEAEFSLRARNLLRYKHTRDALLREYAVSRANALLDGETGLYNHAFFLETLEREVARAQRYHRPLSVLLMQVDGLQRLEEQEGPVALRKRRSLVARALAVTIRSPDVVAATPLDRMGVILPESDSTAAVHAGERLRHEVEASLGKLEGDSKFARTLSVGVAMLEGPGQDYLALLEEAERALSFALASGGSRTAMPRGTSPGGEPGGAGPKGA